MADISKILDRSFESKEMKELVDAPVSALEGVSDADAQKLKDALGIVTIKDLATNKFVLWAQGIVNLA